MSPLDLIAKRLAAPKHFRVVVTDMRPAPMTAEQARAIVAEMRAETRDKPAIRLMRHALGPLGNLSEAARDVYRAEIRRRGGNPEPL